MFSNSDSIVMSACKNCQQGILCFQHGEQLGMGCNGDTSQREMGINEHDGEVGKRSSAHGDHGTGFGGHASQQELGYNGLASQPGIGYIGHASQQELGYEGHANQQGLGYNGHANKRAGLSGCTNHQETGHNGHANQQKIGYSGHADQGTGLKVNANPHALGYNNEEARGLRYKNKVTIITGGSKGIGEGCVRVFVRHGARVVFCARGESAGRSLEEDVNSSGPGAAIFVKCDVSKEEEVKRLVDKAVTLYGRIDCLINNAGYHPPHTEIDDMSVDGFMGLFNTNVISMYLASKFALPYIRKSKGNIINNSSLVASLGQDGALAYAATKGAITSMTKAMAVDEAKHGVRINCISPGNIWTPLWDEGAAATNDRFAAIRSGEEAQLMGRMGTLEESGLVFLFLAADATFMTGVDMPLTGGAELNYGKKTKIKNTKSIVCQMN